MSPKMPDYAVFEEIYTHEYLWRIANLMLTEAKLSEKKAFYFLLSALLMYYMAFEAFINFSGYILFPAVWENEKNYFKGKGDSIEAKISKLLEKLKDFDWQKGKRPYQNIKKLKKFRDVVAHGKVKAYQYEANSTDDGSHIRWEHDWDKFISQKEVEIFMYDIKAFCQSLLESMRNKSDHLHLNHDAFEGPLGFSTGQTKI